jgi:hypothetical protein
MIDCDFPVLVSLSELKIRKGIPVSLLSDRNDSSVVKCHETMGSNFVTRTSTRNHLSYRQAPEMLKLAM